MSAGEQALRRILDRIDGRGYKAYREVEGDWDFDDGLRLTIEHAQADPFASPSRLEAFLPASRLGYEDADLANEVARLALADFLLRRLAHAARDHRDIFFTRPGPEILVRTDLRWGADGLHVRLRANLPARGRRILGRQATSLLIEELPSLLREHLPAVTVDRAALRAHRQVLEDQRALRAQLEELDLVAFLADGAVLPRRSGVSQRPMESAVAFEAPEESAVVLRAPHAGEIRGLGIPSGITLLCGGAFHGKSTVLDAVARSVHDHVPGDGRERCVTLADATTHRAEPGRWVGGRDVRAFLGPLPGGADSSHFVSENASGSTSQAASIVEAVEAGTRLLMVDEDTSASNLLAQDEPMRRLLREEDEPIRHLTRRLRQLWSQWGVSTILVLGGSGAAFSAADLAIQMVEFRPRDVTDRVRRIGEEAMGVEEPGALPAAPVRRWEAASVDPRKGRRPVAIKVHRGGQVSLGRHELDLRACAQVVDDGQVHAALRLWSQVAGGRDSPTLAEALDHLETLVQEKGLSAFRGRGPELSLPRRQDLAAILSRIRGARFRPE